MTIISKIDKYLVDTVNRVRPSNLKGVRTESVASNLPARVVSRKVVNRGENGDQIVTDTVVYLLPNADVVEGDELVVNSVKRPVKKIVPARNKQGVAHHLEASLG